MSIFYKISIDHVNAKYISGWCFHRLRRNRSVVLQCFRKNQLIAEAEANKFREDLKELTVHPTGNCGFEFIFEQAIASDTDEPISIRIKGSASNLAVLSLNDQEGGDRKQFYHGLKKSSKKKHRFSKTVIFMHIPKTAGTTFNTLAQSLFPKGSTITHIELIPSNRYHSFVDQYHYISGHLRFGVFKKHFLPEHVDFYTIIREPYAQLHSHLKWLIQTASNPNDKFFKTTNKTIFELGKSLSRIDFSSNESMSDFVASLTDIEAAFLDNMQTRYFLETEPARVSDPDLKTAITNSRLFKLVGFTENYEVFVTKFKKHSGSGDRIKPGPMNKSKTPDLFDYNNETVKEILKPLVKIDLQLYQLLKPEASSNPAFPT